MKRRGSHTRQLESDPLWYRDAVIYELHVKAFYDSNGDGIGDIRGITAKLDYLEDLGITAVWLLPFYPSPLRDDGYDISDYAGIHPNYGTLRDFRELLDEAHRRGIRVITELVLNHTSDQHAWFQRARRAKPNSVWRKYYVWSDTTERYREARIIFKDFETSNWAWDPEVRAYYWHRFYHHQPDLNYDNPHVKKAVLGVIDSWLSMGVDGLRLDAVPYLVEREGTYCENLEETHEFLKMLRAHVDSKYKDRMLLAEANQWPEDAAAYFGSGDECHMAFHFPLMPRIFMAAQMEDAFPIIDILDQTPAIPGTCQWALFLRNHDELTLEMVTDEERDYMYRVYARDTSARVNFGIRRRLAPLLENDTRKIELVNALLFSLPGTPVIYYGDEIGMGDNYYLGDRDGVRTPMQWSADRNAGFSRANPQKLYLPVIIDPEYHYEAINVDRLRRNTSSLLWWMKRVIGMRRSSRAFGRGSLTFLTSESSKVLAFLREYQGETILVVANLSRFPQAVELDLSHLAGYFPEEMFGRNRFPVIKDSPYPLSLAGYDYYWFWLRKQQEIITMEEGRTIPSISLSGTWPTLFQANATEKIEKILPSYVKWCRWFGGKARTIRRVEIIENVMVRNNSSVTHLLFIRVFYIDGLPEVYLLPLSFSSGDEAERILKENPLGTVARLAIPGAEGVMYEGSYDDGFRKSLLMAIARRQSNRGLHGWLSGYPGKFIRKMSPRDLISDRSDVIKGEQSNTSFVYGDRLFFKLFRRLDEGPNPELEIGRFLSEKTDFQNLPPFGGAIEYRSPDSEPIVVGILQGMVANYGDAWKYTLDSLGMYFEKALSLGDEIGELPGAPATLLEASHSEVPVVLRDLIGGVYLERATLLGRRSAELHLALASSRDDPSFAPEPFTLLYQRSLYQSMESLTRRVFGLLGKNVRKQPDVVRHEARDVLGMESDILGCFRALSHKKISAMKTRIHGDYHLGQVLYTGSDFVIIDFEGEPARSLGQRRLKRSPMRDVASMIRSFHYAAYTALNAYTRDFAPKAGALERLEAHAHLWYMYAAGTFLRSYLETVGDAAFVPKDIGEFEIMLNAFLLEKAVYELGYELDNRPEMVAVPVRGIKHLLGK